MKGTVKFFNDMKGFGFISGEDGKEYFVHQTGIKNNAVLTDNDNVTFDVEQGDRGPKAVNVAKDEGSESPEEEETSSEEEESSTSEDEDSEEETSDDEETEEKEE